MTINKSFLSLTLQYYLKDKNAALDDNIITNDFGISKFQWAQPSNSRRIRTITFESTYKLYYS